MGDNVISSFVAILTAIVGIAILAVVLGPKSDTAGTVGAFGKFFSSIVGKAVSPVS